MYTEDPAVQHTHSISMHNFLDPFRGPCLLSWGLRSRLPNGSEISRAEEDAPCCGSATGPPGRPLRENFSLRSLSSDQKESDSWVCSWPDDTSQGGVFFFQVLHPRQTKGSNNNLLGKRRRSWPLKTASMDGVDFHWQERYNSRQYLIWFLVWLYRSSHREPTPTGRGDK